MFKILSIDGGGIRGIIPAKILAKLENDLARENKSSRLSDYFDLICGTSTGGIIAIGLALGMSANDILELYKQNAKLIFPSLSKWDLLQSLCRDKPFYQRDILKQKLSEAYDSMVYDKPARLGHCLTRVCIPVYDGQKGGMRVLKTPHDPTFYRDYQVPATDAALSTAAAPIYFDTYDFDYSTADGRDLIRDHSMIDGGVIANNPSMIGFVEAVKYLNVPEHEISILSLGTGTRNFKAQRGLMGARSWFFKEGKVLLYDIMSSGQADYIDNIMSFFKRGADGQDRFILQRIQHQFAEGKEIDLGSSDDKSLQELEDIAVQLYNANCSTLIPTFCATEKNPYNPERKF